MMDPEENRDKAAYLAACMGSDILDSDPFLADRLPQRFLSAIDLFNECETAYQDARDKAMSIHPSAS